MHQKNERFLSSFAEKQSLDYIISRYKEKYLTEALNYDLDNNEKNNINNIYDALRFLVIREDYEVPYKELSFKMKLKYFFTHYSNNVYRINRNTK